MQCVRCTRSLLTSARPLVSSMTSMMAKRTFTALTPLRPTLSSFRPSTSVLPASSPSSALGVLDLLPKPVAGPAMASTQIRCGPRDTFSPSHFVRKRRHGFLSRLKSRKGRALLLRRRLKKRNTLSH